MKPTREQLAMEFMKVMAPIYWDTAEEYESGKALVKCLAETSLEMADALLEQLNKKGE